MPRLISFVKTVDQMKDRSKTVTRRHGWTWLKPPTILEAVDRSPRCRGRFERLGLIRVKSIRRERLGSIAPADLILEGFPQLSPEEFVLLYCDGKPDPDRTVTRIEFEHLLEEDARHDEGPEERLRIFARSHRAYPGPGDKAPRGA